MAEKNEIIDITLDSPMTKTDSNIVDMSFLEANKENDDLFSIETDYYTNLTKIAHKKAFVPSLHEQVFEAPLEHAMWTSNEWPKPTRHFPI